MSKQSDQRMDGMKSSDGSTDERPELREAEEGLALAERAAQLIIEKKGRDITILDVGGLTDVARYFVICSCDNDVHVRAVAENVKEELVKEGTRPWKTEGWQGLTWVIMDYVDVVVHVFYRETREFYKLERLWADAPSQQVFDDPAPGIDGSENGERSENQGESE